MKFLEALNPEQREAVLHIKGPLLILAGAGSGKTRVITSRIAYLVGDAHAEPREVLAVTFTNKAAEEMRGRVGRCSDCGRMWVSTFHSLCARLLRREAPALASRAILSFTTRPTSSRRQTGAQQLQIDGNFIQP
jgi:DNA helicase-2/ATP-dependent DNA helicase PcrA